MNEKYKSAWGWLRDLDEKRKERDRKDRLNSLRQGSTKPLPRWKLAK